MLCSTEPLSDQVATGQTPINQTTINQTTINQTTINQTTINQTTINQTTINQTIMPSDITWLGHSTSHITANVLGLQSINRIMTYDDKVLEVALSIDDNSQSKFSY